MGRKNRKGRSGGQRPRRFYRPKRSRGREAGPAEAGPDAIPRRVDWDLREVRAPAASAGPAAARTCGRCAEWTPRAGALDDPSRGACLHPGSGISYPPADMQACDFFH